MYKSKNLILQKSGKTVSVRTLNIKIFAMCRKIQCFREDLSCTFFTTHRYIVMMTKFTYLVFAKKNDLYSYDRP